MYSGRGSFYGGIFAGPGTKQLSAERKSEYHRTTVTEQKKEQNKRPDKNTVRPDKGTPPGRDLNRPSRPGRPVPPPANRPSRPGNPPANRPPHPGNRPSPPSRPGVHRPVPPGYGHPRPPHRPVVRPSGIRRYGHAVPVLPYGAVMIRRGGVRYYYLDGCYYRPHGTSFVISRPPAGTVVSARLAAGNIRLEIYYTGNRKRYYYTDDDGIYYRKSGNNYIVIDPPVGAVVRELPYDYEEALIGGEVYYRVDDTYYEAVVYPGGRVYYRVVGKRTR